MTTDMDTVHLYEELLIRCKQVGWSVVLHDPHDRFMLVPDEGYMTALYSDSLLECIGFVNGYTAGRRPQ